jgi:two-component system cell cycle response regulator CpdR
MDVRDSRVHNYPPPWNGAPSQDLLVMRRNRQTGEVSLDPLRWGLIPYWCGDPKGGRSTVNLRVPENAPNCSVAGLWSLLKVEPSAELAMPTAVLIVDDEPLIFSLTSAVLEGLGCEVLSAGSGADAIGSTRRRFSHRSLLLTEIQIPEMSSYELAAEVRQRWPELPIVVMSGNDLGAHGYVVVRKRFSQQQLARVRDAARN